MVAIRSDSYIEYNAVGCVVEKVRSWIVKEKSHSEASLDGKIWLYTNAIK